MWITEIREQVTAKLMARYEHGASWSKAMDSHNSLVFRYAAHRVHLVWQEPIA